MQFRNEYGVFLPEDPAGFCDVCLCQIYDGDEAYEIDGFTVCTDCFPEYARSYFAENRTFGWKLRKGKRRYDS